MTKRTKIIRIDEETYNQLKKTSDKTEESISKIMKKMFKGMKGKKLSFDIEF